jgi:alpha-mannosidase
MPPETETGREVVEASARTVHLIGNAHMDPVWIWDWREGFGEVWATFRAALDRLAEHADVVFTASSAAHHAWIEQHDEALFEQIRAAVAAGRWCLVGGMWVEPDCNLPSGESFCRQLLVGQRFFQRAFGRVARTGYNVDSFGHAAGLPQLLSRSGLGAYVMMRPAAHERELPGQAFRWGDADGSTVLAYRIPFDYATDSAEQIPERVQELDRRAESENTPMMLFYGIGNHGGGPTRAMLQAIDTVAADDAGVAYSDPDRYFAELESRRPALPLVHGELQHHAVGCYSVSAWVKRENDRCEAALLGAESAEVVASRLVGRRYRAAELTAAWKELLLCQFHDTLAGTASESAYGTVRARFGYVETMADQVTTNAVYEIAHRVDTSLGLGGPVQRDSSFWTGNEGSGVPFLAYNPLGWPVRQVIEAPRSSAAVLDSDGNEIASQAVASGEVTLFRSHSLFVAELGPLGYEIFWLRGGTARLPDGPAPATQPVIESDVLRAVVEVSTGSISSLVDLASGTELIGDGGIRPVVLADRSDTWSHGLIRYEGEQVPCEFVGWETIESGPLRWRLQLRFRSDASFLTMDLCLARAASFAEIRLRADWSTPHVVLKLVMPWRLGPEVVTVAGAAYGHAVRRPSGAEEPLQGWLDCYDPTTDRGVGCTTDYLHGYDATGATTRLTVLRNPLAGDHGGGWAARPGDDYPYTDSGRHQASVRIHPHSGDWQAAGLVARAVEHLRRPIVVADTYHSGDLPAKGAFLRVEPPGAAVVRALKRAENDEGIVVRLVEATGAHVAVALSGRLLGRAVAAELAPYEVQTVLVPDDASAPARVVDIAELEHSTEAGAESWPR